MNVRDVYMPKVQFLTATLQLVQYAKCCEFHFQAYWTVPRFSLHACWNPQKHLHMSTLSASKDIFVSCTNGGSKDLFLVYQYG